MSIKVLINLFSFPFSRYFGSHHAQLFSSSVHSLQIYQPSCDIPSVFALRPISFVSINTDLQLPKVKINNVTYIEEYNDSDSHSYKE